MADIFLDPTAELLIPSARDDRADGLEREIRGSADDGATVSAQLVGQALPEAVSTLLTKSTKSPPQPPFMKRCANKPDIRLVLRIPAVQNVTDLPLDAVSHHRRHRHRGEVQAP